MSDVPKTPEAAPEQQQINQVGQLFYTLAKDPKHRAEVLGLIKKAAPDTYIPELDLAADVDRKVTERVKPFEDSTTELRKEIADLKSVINRSQFSAAHGLAEDEIKEVEEFAKDNGITKGDKAVDLWRQSLLGRPRSTPQAKEGEAYIDKIRKIRPTNAIALKNAAIDEGKRIMRSMRGQRRAG